MIIFFNYSNKGFGFCEYSDPEAALRAMRLLSGFHVADKKLLVSWLLKWNNIFHPVDRYALVHKKNIFNLLLLFYNNTNIQNYFEK